MNLIPDTPTAPATTLPTPATEPVTAETVRQIVREEFDVLKTAVTVLQFRQDMLEKRVDLEKTEMLQVIESHEAKLKMDVQGMIKQALAGFEETATLLAESVTKRVTELSNGMSDLIGRVDTWQHTQAEIRVDINTLQANLAKNCNDIVTMQSGVAALNTTLFGSAAMPAVEPLITMVRQIRDGLPLMIRRTDTIEGRVLALETEVKQRKERIKRVVKAALGGLKSPLLKWAAFFVAGSGALGWLGGELQWWDLF